MIAQLLRRGMQNCRWTDILSVCYTHDRCANTGFITNLHYLIWIGPTGNFVKKIAKIFATVILFREGHLLSFPGSYTIDSA